MPNPFGTDETPAKFSSFDIFTKIRTLQHMTQIIMKQPEKLRERMTELKEADHDHTSWRIEPYGWDRHDRTYFVLDDNRIYRLTDAPPPPPPAPKPKKNSKKARAAARASKRRRLSAALESAAEDGGDEASENGYEPVEEIDDGLGGMKWECIAVNLDQVRDFLATIQKTKDPNEKVLRDQVQEHLVPILEAQEEKRKRREKEREKELLNLAKMANAKRSSRIANKVEHQRQEEIAQEEERKRSEEVAAARKAEQQRRKLERERESRMMSRENRLKDREARRLQHEEELAQLSEDSKNMSSGTGRVSERKLQADIERSKQALKELEEEEDDWVFDCICGLHGQVDDGQHSVACERCNVWQHSKCLGISESDAERDDFHFICESCHRRQEEKERLGARKPVIKIKVNRPGSSSSASAPQQPTSTTGTPNGPTSSTRMVVEIDSKPPATNATETPKPHAHSSPISVVTNGLKDAPSVLAPPRPEFNPSIPIKTDGAASQESLPSGGELRRASLNGQNPFSSPHPGLSPPNQSPNKSRAYGTIYDQPSPVPNKIQTAQGQSAGTSNGVPRKISTTPILPPTFARPPSSNSNSKPIPAVSPSKAQAHSEPMAKAAVPSSASSPPTVPAVPPTPTTTHPGQQSQATPSSTLATTPRLTPIHGGGAQGDLQSPTLPPQSGGLSPIKHSPPARKDTAMSGVFPSSSPTPPILPPIAALSPSPRQQNLTPPVKHDSFSQESSLAQQDQQAPTVGGPNGANEASVNGGSA
ncbi:uncharacterized protein E0L32_003080 [Thyridium curvatum]|uniref:Zinc finger PHD-type domain-containing protein n=1 Tax=Thyridium curvatum TaxID=1093900 RepID=A0A507BC06_9PEZI|nr:uncharacterized protein E0L32_003080 [Thyridium curvatum]TPX17437.1 hypothetical protein E0L32_003080 [Thyridium curvatum]